MTDDFVLEFDCCAASKRTFVCSLAVTKYKNRWHYKKKVVVFLNHVLAADAVPFIAYYANG
jgi:hypothetical protein